MAHLYCLSVLNLRQHVSYMFKSGSGPVYSYFSPFLMGLQAQVDSPKLGRIWDMARRVMRIIICILFLQNECFVKELQITKCETTFHSYGMRSKCSVFVGMLKSRSQTREVALNELSL